MSLRILAQAGLFGHVCRGFRKCYHPPFYTTPKPEFSSDEKKNLAEMAGKNKKRYVKLLKEKYSDQTRAIFK